MLSGLKTFNFGNITVQVTMELEHFFKERYPALNIEDILEKLIQKNIYKRKSGTIKFTNKHLYILEQEIQ